VFVHHPRAGRSRSHDHRLVDEKYVVGGSESHLRVRKTKKLRFFRNFFPESFADSKKSSTFASLSGRKGNTFEKSTRRKQIWWL
jgi:hypothetical protein